MTFSIRNVIGIVKVHGGKEAPKALFFTNYDQWSYWQKKLFDYVIGCHTAHTLEFLVALICYLFLFPVTFPEAKEWHYGWVSKVVAFNLGCEFLIYSFWHYMTYASNFSTGKLRDKKFNPNNQYSDQGQKAGFFSSSSGHLQREVFFTTLGWLQSSAYQCVMMYLWASGKVAYYDDFWAYPAYSLFFLLFVTYWREFHFYWAHRMIHPWWNGKNGLAQGDIGAFLYRWFHSLHHKSYNPGPWSGLSMHPVEHFIYYSCTLLPLIFVQHPIHFLFAKFHADIAPIGGHDGYADPGGNGDFHWLHHAKFECNYGVPLIDFDRLFGSWVDYEDYKKAGSVKAAKLAAGKIK